jgi:hypothetical protein
MRKQMILWQKHSPKGRESAARKKEMQRLLKFATKHHNAEQRLVKKVKQEQRRALSHAWLCGHALNAIKHLVGHGHWLRCVQHNFCIPHGITYRTAALYMKIHSDNANVQSIADLKLDTVRKYAWRFVPEKRAVQLPGDGKIPRLTHHLSVLNDFSRLKHRHDTGLQPIDSTEVRRDWRPIYDWLKEIYGDS